MISPQHIQALAGIVGDSGVLCAPADLSPYETDARAGRGRAAFVVRPRNTAQVSRVVSYCVRAGVDLIAQGANSGLVGGSTPDCSGEQGILSFDRFCDPIEVDPQNRTVCVGAGVRLSVLNRHLEPYGLCVPIDLAADPSIGGMVATNTGGSRFVRYGDVRKQVRGLEVVLPDSVGTVLNLLTKVRKNNVGLDTKQLFIGTGGAYGFVTKVVLEVHRMPKQRATAILVPRDDQAVIDLLCAFEDRCGNELAAFEGMSRNAMLAALTHVPNLRNPFLKESLPEFAILVEVTRSWTPRLGEPTIEESLAAILEDLWSQRGGGLADAYIGAPEAFWSLRHALPEGIRLSGRVFAFDVSFARTDLMNFRRAMAGELASRFPTLRICDFGHIADGGVHYNLVEPAECETKLDHDEVASLRQLVFDRVVREFHGSFSAEHGIGRANVAYYGRFVHPQARHLAAAIGNAVCSGPGVPAMLRTILEAK